MIDRIAMGEVVDFIDVTATNIFPFNCIFNVADAFVCVGCVLLILSFVLDEIKEKKKDNADKGCVLEAKNTDETSESEER